MRAAFRISEALGLKEFELRLCAQEAYFPSQQIPRRFDNRGST